MYTFSVLSHVDSPEDVNRKIGAYFLRINVPFPVFSFWFDKYKS